MATDTSSSAALSNCVVAAAANWFAVPIAEPIPANSLAAIANASGTATTYDISPPG